MLHASNIYILVRSAIYSFKPRLNLKCLCPFYILSYIMTFWLLNPNSALFPVWNCAHMAESQMTLCYTYALLKCFNSCVVHYVGSREPFEIQPQRGKYNTVSFVVNKTGNHKEALMEISTAVMVVI